jgi:uncharacterized protein (TIGR00251 family)
LDSRRKAPFALREGRARIALKVTPRASRDRVAGIEEAADGSRLKVTVTAVPEDGKANEAVVKLLARTWGLPKTALSIVAGATGRLKEVEVEGDPAVVLAWFEAQGFRE